MKLTPANISIPAPSTLTPGHFPGRPAGSGGQPGAEAPSCRRDTLSGRGTQEGCHDACAQMYKCLKSRSPGGSVRPQDVQQELGVDLSGVDPPTVQVQQVADRLLLRVQHRDGGGMAPQVQLRLGASRRSRQSGRGDVLPKVVAIRKARVRKRRAYLRGRGSGRASPAAWC